jgi:hypothetical protein
MTLTAVLIAVGVIALILLLLYLGSRARRSSAPVDTHVEAPAAAQATAAG